MEAWPVPRVAMPGGRARRVGRGELGAGQGAPGGEPWGGHPTRQEGARQRAGQTGKQSGSGKAAPPLPHLLHWLLFQVLGLPYERELWLLAHLLEMVGPQGQHLCGEGGCGAHTCASGPRLQAPPLNL